MKLWELGIAVFIGVSLAVIMAGPFQEAMGLDSGAVLPGRTLDGTPLKAPVSPGTTQPPVRMRPPASVPFRLVSFTVAPAQVQNLEYRVASIWAPPEFTVTLDRATGSGEVVKIWVTSSAPDIVEPPKSPYDEKGYPVTGPSNFVLVTNNTNKASFGLNIHAIANLTSPRTVTITASNGTSQASTYVTILPPPPNPVTSLTVTNADLPNGRNQGSQGPQFTVTLAQAVMNVVRSSSGTSLRVGEKVWITSSDPSIVLVPKASYSETGGPVTGPSNFVVVNYGSNKEGFPLSTEYIESLTSEKKVTITASNSTGSASAQVTITPLPGYRVISATVSPASFRVGQSATNPVMTVTLDRPVARPMGIINYYYKVWVASSAPDIAVPPARAYDPTGLLVQGDNRFIAISPGFSSGNGTVSIVPGSQSVLTAPVGVTLNAGAGLDRASAGVQASTSLTVSPILLKRFGLSIQPVQPLYAGSTNGIDRGLGTLETDYPSMTSPIQVKLSSAEPDVLNFTGTWESSPSPYWCTLPAGVKGGNFNVVAIPLPLRKTFIGEDRNVAITAEYMGQRLTASVPVLWPRAVSSLVIMPPGQYGSSTATITLDRPAPANGLQLQISSSNRGAFVILPYAVNMSGGHTSASFSLALRAPYVTYAGTTVTVTAAPYWNSSATATVPVQ